MIPLHRSSLEKTSTLTTLLLLMAQTKLDEPKTLPQILMLLLNSFTSLSMSFFETLFQGKVTPHRVESKMCILGYVSAYFSTVESQGWGTLHLHIHIWLKHAPSFDEIHELLKRLILCMGGWIYTGQLLCLSSRFRVCGVSEINSTKQGTCI